MRPDTDTPSTQDGLGPSGPAVEQCTPRRGRPRSEAAEQAIFEAVERLLEDGTGLSEFSIERIAAAAGVGKATIYRRWPNKESLLVDVIARLEEPPIEPRPGGTLRDDLIAMVDRLRRRGLAKRSRWVVESAVGQLRARPELQAVYHERIVKPRRAMARALILRGMDHGEIRDDLDPELVVDLLFGPILVRVMVCEDTMLDDPKLAEQLVDAALQGVAPRKD